MVIAIIDVGKTVPLEKRAFFKLYNEGLILLAATTGYGKSVLLNNLIVQISKFKRVIVFDFKGEHKNLRSPNISDYSKGIKVNLDSVPTLKIISKVGFYIEDCKRPAIWGTFGLSEKPSEVVASIASNVELHNNDINTFSMILADFPVSTDEIVEFEAKYGVKGVVPLHSQQKTSMMRGFESAQRFLCTPMDVEKGKTNRLSVKEWREVFIKNRHLLFDLNLTDERGRKAGQFYVSMLLDYIQPILYKLKPCFVFEEADILFPSEVSDYGNVLCVDIVNRYALKEQKQGVIIVNVVQKVRNLQFSLRDAHLKFLGLLDPQDYFYAEYEVSRLKWDRSKNYREFIMAEKGGIELVFVPNHSYVTVDHRY